MVSPRPLRQRSLAINDEPTTEVEESEVEDYELDDELEVDGDEQFADAESAFDDFDEDDEDDEDDDPITLVAFEDEEAVTETGPEVEEDLDLEGDSDGLRAGEFVCRSCYMAKRESALADPQRMLCRDCA